MKKTKPDRFERMITHELVPSEVVKLLRKEHRAVVRLAKKVQGWQAEQLAESDDAFDAFLTELTERAK